MLHFKRLQRPERDQVQVRGCRIVERRRRDEPQASHPDRDAVVRDLAGLRHPHPEHRRGHPVPGKPRGCLHFHLPRNLLVPGQLNDSLKAA